MKQLGLALALLLGMTAPAQAAISFVCGVGNSAIDGGDVTLDLTGCGLQQGDLAIVTSAVGDTGSSDVDMVMVTSGYTEVADLFADDTFEIHLGVYWKIMGATPDSDAVVDGFGGTDAGVGAVVMVFRGVDQTTPMDVAPATDSGINTMHPNPPSLNHNNPSGVWTVLAVGNPHTSNTEDYTFPTGYTTNAVENGTNGAETVDATAGMGYNTSPADPEDPGALVHAGTDSTGFAWAAVTLALRPAAAGGGGVLGSGIGNGGVIQ